MANTHKMPAALEHEQLKIPTYPELKEITSHFDTSMDLLCGPLSPIEEVSQMDEESHQGIRIGPQLAPLPEVRDDLHCKQNPKHTALPRCRATAIELNTKHKQKSLIALPVQSPNSVSSTKFGLHAQLIDTSHKILRKDETSGQPVVYPKKSFLADHDSRNTLPQDCQSRYDQCVALRMRPDGLRKQSMYRGKSSGETSGRSVLSKNLSVFPHPSTKNQSSIPKEPSKSARYDFVNGHVNDVFPGYSEESCRNRPLNRQQQKKQLVELEHLVQSGQKLFTLLKSSEQPVQTGQVMSRVAEKIVPCHVSTQRDTLFVAKTINSGREMISSIETSIGHTSGCDSETVEDSYMDDSGQSEHNETDGPDLNCSVSETSFEGSPGCSTLYNLNNVSLTASIERSNQDRRRHSEIPSRANRASDISLLSIYSTESIATNVSKGKDESIGTNGITLIKDSQESFQPPDSPTYLDHLTDGPAIMVDTVNSVVTPYCTDEPNFAKEDELALDLQVTAGTLQDLHKGAVAGGKVEVPSRRSRSSIVKRRRRSTSAPPELNSRSSSLADSGNIPEPNDKLRHSSQKFSNTPIERTCDVEPAIIERIVHGNHLDVVSRMSRTIPKDRISQSSELAITCEDAIGIFPPFQHRISSTSRPRSTIISRYFYDPKETGIEGTEFPFPDQSSSTRRPPSTGLKIARPSFSRAESGISFSLLKKKKVKKLQIGTPHLISSSSNISTVALRSQKVEQSGKLPRTLEVPKPRSGLLKLLTSNCNRSQASIKRCLSPVSIRSFHTDGGHSRSTEARAISPQPFNQKMCEQTSSRSLLSRI